VFPAKAFLAQPTVREHGIETCPYQIDRNLIRLPTVVSIMTPRTSKNLSKTDPLFPFQRLIRAWRSILRVLLPFWKQPGCDLHSSTRWRAQKKLR